MKKILVTAAVFLTFLWSIIGTIATVTAQDKPLLVGMEAGYPPYNWTQNDDSNGAVPIKGTNIFANGYDVQIARKIGEALGRKVEVVKIEWDGLIPALQANKIDMIVAGMSPTEERAKAIDFSEAYYESRFVMVTTKDSKYAAAKSINDFAKAKVTGQLGTLHYDLLEQLKDADVQQAQKSFPIMRVGLQSGKIDAYISELPEAISATAANDAFTFIELDPTFDVKPEDKITAIGLKKGNELRDKVNEALKNINSDERSKLMEEAIKNQPTE